MAKMHELLAVAANLKGQAVKTLSGLRDTFTKKRHLFESKRKSFTPNEEGKPVVVEEQSDIQTSVQDELEWVAGHWSKFIDSSHQIDIGNTLAFADLIDEDGTTLVPNVPATSLLQLEKQVKEFQGLLETIPTLDPAKGFRTDAAAGKYYFVAREVTKPRTRKDKKIITKAPATDKFPAQVEVYDADIEIGHTKEQEWSALITPSRKAVLIDRCERLHRAVAKARAKANESEVNVKEHKIGKKLLDYVIDPKHES